MKSRSVVIVLVILNCNFIINTLYITFYFELIMCSDWNALKRVAFKACICPLCSFVIRHNKIGYFFWKEMGLTCNNSVVCKLVLKN